MLEKSAEELVAIYEKAIVDWPWEGRDTSKMEIILDSEFAKLIDSFGFDDALKRGLFFCLVMSRSLRLAEEAELQVKIKPKSEEKSE